jgi:hypothetical protein
MICHNYRDLNTIVDRRYLAYDRWRQKFPYIVLKRGRSCPVCSSISAVEAIACAINEKTEHRLFSRLALIQLDSVILSQPLSQLPSLNIWQYNSIKNGLGPKSGVYRNLIRIFAIWTSLCFSYTQFITSLYWRYLLLCKPLVIKRHYTWSSLC